MKCRVFKEPSGNVRIVYPNERLRNPGESDDSFVQRIGATVATNDPSLIGLPFVDVDQATLHALDRMLRHKWRTSGQAVVVDPTVPDKPHPRQALLNEIGAATTIAELKTILTKFVKG